jgi:hypothetical protein
MKDVCRLDDDETLAVLRWAAMALLRAALDEAPLSVPAKRSNQRSRDARLHPASASGS